MQFSPEIYTFSSLTSDVDNNDNSIYCLRDQDYSITVSINNSKKNVDNN